MGKTLVDESNAAKLLRTLVLATLILGMAGVAIELVLLEHMEDRKQWIPLALISLGTVAIILYGLTKAGKVLRAFQIIMLLFVVSGFLGIWFHYRGNVEFELEMYPSMKGLELMGEALKGATPALAPGTMIQLGLIGLIYTFRHPGFARKQPSSDPNQT